MKYINLSILKILSRADDLLQLDRNARKVKATVQSDYERGGRFKRDSLRPWKEIPNIWRFDIEKGLFDWLLLLFGYLRRSYTKLTFYSWKNGHANAYLDYMFKRLHTQVKLGDILGARKTFWLLLNSSAYRVSAFNYVCKGWYKNMDVKVVQRTLEQVKKLAKSKNTDIQFKRTYILKADGKSWRPLGVPSIAWRVYLHMINNLITQWRLVSEGNAQHAYLPGRGVITAWERLLKLIERPNIYEADYEKFFDSVSHVGIRHALVEKLKIPESIKEFINSLNESLVELTEEDKISEPDRKVIITKDDKYNPQANPELDPRAISGHGFLEYINNPGVYKTLFDAEKAVRQGKALYKNVEPSYPKKLLLQSTGDPVMKMNGVPQGAPTSCSTATLPLRFLEAKYELLLYADDVIYFPKSSDCNPIKDLTIIQLGLKVNPSKSRWVKRDGIWVAEELRFLGFKYIPRKQLPLLNPHFVENIILFATLDMLLIGLPLFSLIWLLINWNGIRKLSRPRFMASTRNGAQLEFTRKQAFLAFLNNARTWMLNTSATQELRGERLESWILSLYPKFESIKNPIKLWANLFGPRVLTEAKHESDIKFWTNHLNHVRSKEKQIESEITKDDVRQAESILRGILTRKPGEEYTARLPIPHVNLTGWFAARMQYNSWTIEIPQDFRLKWTTKSWIATKWDEYSAIQGLSKKVLTTFTASSFATHWLLQEQRYKASIIHRVLIK